MPLLLRGRVIDGQQLGRQASRELRMPVSVDDLVLEPPDEDLVEGLLVGRDAAGEAVGIEQLEQRLP